MLTYAKLIKVVEESVDRNGADKVLTLNRLLNILKVAEIREANERKNRIYQKENIMDEMHTSNFGSNE